MSATRRLIEKIRGFQVGDYVRVRTSFEGIFYGEVLELRDWFNPLEEKYERLAKIQIRNSREAVLIPLDDEKWEVRLARRRKK